MIVTVIVIAAIIFIATREGKPSVVKKEPCKLHNWAIDDNGKYWCQECGLVAGTISTENGEY